ncbi:BON domain-containing protein [Chitinimonas arctica]|uniref:Osmotically-inducible protein Y n=1 Tax=Chitinimonas arctica TaxID=2594795 RepID=A0A516SB53_9NEIS|nr:BON domain-containing protein [Chitinimonas arctica]QDQ25377.1 BON domain-containing protein [Chitinimonas arctica]
MQALPKFVPTLFMAFMLGATAGCSSTPRYEGTGEYIDDSVITTKVKAAVLNEPSLKVAEINVETYKGAVQLSGFVNSRTAADIAVKVARNVHGVKSVRDEMRIK